MTAFLRSTFLFCALVPASAEAAPRMAPVGYTCSDGTRLSAAFSQPGGTAGSALLRLAGRRMTLPQVMSADGGRYSRGDTEFWIKGEGATLTRRGTATDCRAVR